MAMVVVGSAECVVLLGVAGRPLETGEGAVSILQKMLLWLAEEMSSVTQYFPSLCSKVVCVLGVAGDGGILRVVLQNQPFRLLDLVQAEKLI